MQQGLPPLRVAVNLSVRQLLQKEFAASVEAVLADTGLPPHLLELELTESQLMDNPVAAQAQVSALKALGVQIAIDDFGTGYSSLAYLKRFEIDKLKVDQSFVYGMLDDSADAFACLQPRDQRFGHFALVVLVGGDQRLVQAEAGHQLGGVAGVFAGHCVHQAQNMQRSQTYISDITDRGRHYVQCCDRIGLSENAAVVPGGRSDQRMQHALRRAGQIVRACDVNYKPDAATGSLCATDCSGTAARG
eukprot:gene31183-35199_t